MEGSSRLQDASIQQNDQNNLAGGESRFERPKEPLRYHHKAPCPRFNYGLDQEEREIIKKGAHLSKQEIWERLELKRFNELKKAAINLQGELLVQRRCPKCTLIPPCQHYKTPDKIVSDAQRLMASPKFKESISPTKRSNLLKMVKSQHTAGASFYNTEQSLMMTNGDNNANQYYIDTLQAGAGSGAEENDSPTNTLNTISINRVVQ